jgi:hypothetical protein
MYNSNLCIVVTARRIITIIIIVVQISEKDHAGSRRHLKKMKYLSSSSGMYGVYCARNTNHLVHKNLW